MRIIIQIIAIVLLGYLAETFLPWYSIAFVALITGFWMSSESNFIGGFLGVGILWGIKIFKVMAVAAADLAGRVAMIFPVKEPWILITTTLVIGGLVGGFACTTGGLLRRKKKRNDIMYYR